MAVREYIGARYVPIFGRKGEDSIEWDNTKPYEPLTIVLYQGNSYTSRQYVPAGIGIDNGEFWAQTGSYNAQVEQYRTEVRTFDSRITANAQGIATNTEAIQGNTEAIQGNTEAIQGNTEAIQGNAQAIAAETAAREALFPVSNSNIANGAITPEKLANSINPYSYFNGYNVVFIGDSYTYGTGASDHLSGDTKRFSSLLATWLGMTEFNYGVGSTGFCDPGSSGQNAPFKTQVLTAANSMTAEQRRNTHLVVIAGGVNDYNEGATYGAGDMQAGSHDAAVNAKNNFPNAIILVVPMLYKGWEANPRLLNFENALINGVGGLQHVERTVYIRGAWTWNFGMASHYISDKLHPNDLGHQTIASQIYAHVLGGNAYENRLISFEFESGYGSNVANGGYLQFENGVVVSSGMVISGTVSANSTTKIGTIATGAGTPLQNIMAIVSKSNKQTGIAIITASGSLYVHATEDISEFYIAPFSFVPAGTLI